MKTAPVIFLQNDKVILRAVELDDAERCQRWVNDPETRRYLAEVFPLSAIGERKLIEAMNATKPPTDIVFAIVAKDELGDEHVGCVGMHKINWHNGRTMLGIMIGEKGKRGRGVGTQAINLVCEYAFNTLRLHRVTATVIAENQMSLRMFERCGFRREGVLKDHYFREGKYMDEVQFAIHEDEWRARQTA